MKAFFVISRETCPTCHGSRVVANPLWVRYFCETDENTGAEAWAREQGFDTADDMGPQEEPCQDCEGEGTVQRLVPLQEALSVLGVGRLPHSNVEALNSGDGSYRP